MNRTDEKANLGQAEDGLELDPELREAIGNFKSSVDAWGDAMASRPREARIPARANWGLVPKWALGCAVFIGTVSGGVYQNHREQENAKIEAARTAQQERELAAKRAQDEADLMAKVDTDISREVPSALEPMASLMDENQGTGN